MHVQLWRCIIPVPVEVEALTVPLFKAPINGRIDLWGPECGGTFILDYSLVNVGHLLHKSRPVPFVFSSTVYLYSLCLHPRREKCTVSFFGRIPGSLDPLRISQKINCLFWLDPWIPSWKNGLCLFWTGSLDPWIPEALDFQNLSSV